MILAKNSTQQTQAIVRKGSLSNVVAGKVRVCDNFWKRLRGLLGTSHLSKQEACWIKQCNSVHTMGMKYAIDVYFLSKENEVVAIVKNMKPNRFSKIYNKAHSVLEFASGNDQPCELGDQISFVQEAA